MVKTNKKIYADLLTILLWNIAAFIFIISPTLQNSITRIILSVPIVLFIPGYLTIGALFPKKDDIGTIERIAFSFGLSIAILSLLGFLLNFVFGIRLIPILVSICTYNLVLIYITFNRRRELPENLQFSIKFDNISGIVQELNIPRDKIGLIVAAILLSSIALLAGMVNFIITTPSAGEKFTEFYILGQYGKADNYSKELKLGYPATILAGVVNHEQSYVNYTLQIVLEKNIIFSENLLLNNNEKWQKNVTFSPDKKGKDMKLELLLFKENNFAIPYRELHLWVDST